MKNIHYDVEGDILSITFAEVKDQLHAGVELTDNIVLYFNSETEEPIKLLLLSYRRLLQASAWGPFAAGWAGRFTQSIADQSVKGYES
jgi:hypothetical protein